MMPAMGKGCRCYKDVVVAPGTQLMAALDEGDHKKAAAIYNECERDLARLEGRLTYFAADGTLMVTKTGARSIFDDVDE